MNRVMILSKTLHTGALCLAFAVTSQVGSACNQQAGKTLDRQPQIAMLVKRLKELEPWGGSQYSRQGWRALIVLARVVQKMDPEVVASALDTFVKPTLERGVVRYDDQQSKPFLLLRVVFDVPEGAPQEYFPVFKRWVCVQCWSTPGQRGPGWPMSWGGDEPYLVAPYLGSTGRSYAVAAEYQYLRERFPMRNLESFPASLGPP